MREFDLTAAVEHLYGRRCPLLWLGWVDILCCDCSRHDSKRIRRTRERRFSKSNTGQIYDL